MSDLLKKVLYTSVGFASIATEKLQETVSELVDKSKLSEDEGKKIVDDFMETTESKKDEFESKLTKLVEDVVKTFDFPKGNDVADLNARIKSLEAKLGVAATATADTATKTKTTAAKRTTRRKKTDTTKKA